MPYFEYLPLIIHLIITTYSEVLEFDYMKQIGLLSTW